MGRSTRSDDYQDVPRPIAALADEYPPNFYDPPHSHKRSQLVYAISGVLVVTTRDATFVVPPQRALWLPSGVVHEVRSRGHVSLRTLYLDDDAVSVLPRAVLYGEGGTEEMAYHERDLERFGIDELGDRQAADGRSYLYTLPPFDRPVSASLPRLLAPESPSWATSVLPYLIGAAGLMWGARRARRRADGDDAALVLLGAALVACVVTSPTGWAMGLVWALPIAPLAWAPPPTGPPARARWLLRGAWIACAVPPLFGGWAAIAGGTLALAAAHAALAREPTA